MYTSDNLRGSQMSARGAYRMPLKDTLMNLSVADETSLQSPIKELFVEDPARSRDWTSIALESARSLVFLDDDHCTVLRKASERPTKSDRFSSNVA